MNDAIFLGEHGRKAVTMWAERPQPDGSLLIVGLPPAGAMMDDPRMRFRVHNEDGSFQDFPVAADGHIVGEPIFVKAGQLVELVWDV